MFDKTKPYNELPLISSIIIDETTSLQRLAEDIEWQLKY